MITIDLSSSTPLNDQITRELRRVIAEGNLSVGDELPAVRQLAADLQVNFNTVARAYRALEASGLVRSARGRGSRVVAVLETDRDRAQQSALDTLQVALVDARLAGFDRALVMSHLGERIESFWGTEPPDEPTPEEPEPQ